VYGTFSTAGADGTISLWDKDSKQRLKTLPKANGTIACTAYNRTGNILAYAISYDWTKVIHPPLLCSPRILIIIFSF
jgi:mRNA export factor